jgi:hypothetical protein
MGKQALIALGTVILSMATISFAHAHYTQRYYTDYKPVKVDVNTLTAKNIYSHPYYSYNVYRATRITNGTKWLPLDKYGRKLSPGQLARKQNLYNSGKYVVRNNNYKIVNRGISLNNFRNNYNRSIALNDYRYNYYQNNNQFNSKGNYYNQRYNQNLIYKNNSQLVSWYPRSTLQNL